MVKIQQEILLNEKIQQIAYEQPYYGYRRITTQLHRDNIKVNHKRVIRIMRELGIQGRIRRKYVTTTNSRHNNQVYPNLIKDFLTTSINQICSCDITYISILFVFVYLAVIIDIYSRQLVGYAIVKSLSPQLAIASMYILSKVSSRSSIRISGPFSVFLFLIFAPALSKPIDKTISHQHCLK